MKKITKEHDEYFKFVQVENEKHYEICPDEGCEIICPHDEGMSVMKENGKIIIKKNGIKVKLQKISEENT
jgi:hypothetical protein